MALPKLPGTPKRLAGALLAWYAEQKRDLPWRGSGDPYAIWVSEVMLQQTQASVVGPYYARFLEAFPTVEALAHAPLAEVLCLWSGLGYYSRARTMHAAAQRLAAEGFPRTLEALRALPGFGPYTAAAVGSIAFGLPEPAIDGNAVRVYARLIGLRAERAKAEPALREAVRPLLAAGEPGDLNQAIMDLGQRVCTVRSPRCTLCPWQKQCRALAEDAVDEIPLRKKARPRTRLRWIAAVARREGALLLARRAEKGLFGGLWELPSAEGPRSDDDDDHGDKDQAEAEALSEALHQELGLRADVGGVLGAVERVLTHRDLSLVARDARVRGRLAPRPGGAYLEARWVKPDALEALGLSSATRALLAAIDQLADPVQRALPFS